MPGKGINPKFSEMITEGRQSGFRGGSHRDGHRGSHNYPAIPGSDRRAKLPPVPKH